MNARSNPPPPSPNQRTIRFNSCCSTADLRLVDYRYLHWTDSVTGFILTDVELQPYLVFWAMMHKKIKTTNLFFLIHSPKLLRQLLQFRLYACYDCFPALFLNPLGLNDLLKGSMSKCHVSSHVTTQLLLWPCICGLLAPGGVSKPQAVISN